MAGTSPALMASLLAGVGYAVVFAGGANRGVIVGYGFPDVLAVSGLRLVLRHNGLRGQKVTNGPDAPFLAFPLPAHRWGDTIGVHRHGRGKRADSIQCHRH